MQKYLRAKLSTRAKVTLRAVLSPRANFTASY